MYKPSLKTSCILFSPNAPYNTVWHSPPKDDISICTKVGFAKLRKDHRHFVPKPTEVQTNSTSWSTTQKLWDNEEEDDPLTPHSFCTCSTNPQQ